MTGGSVRVGVGTRFLYDGDPFEVVDMRATTAGNELVLRAMRGRSDLLCVSLRELRTSERARVIPDLPGPSSDDPGEPASVVLAELTESLQNVNEAGKVWDDAQQLSGLYQLIYTLPKPTIAAVNGAAVAGGAGFVTVCDLALAVPEAKFGYPEVRRGLVAAMVMPHLLRHVGERCARYLLLTGELIDAEEARRTGLINDVVLSADHLLERSLALAKSLAEGGPNALTLTKALLAQFSRQALSVEETAKASAAPRLSPEARAGLEAFFAKKPAPWAPKG